MSTTAAVPSLASAVPFVKQSRVIRTSRNRAYEAWTKPEIVQKWFGPANRFCPLAVLDVREGGLFRIEAHAKPDAVLPPGQPQVTCAEGVYTEVLPGERLQFTWKPSWNPGEESLVTVTFRDADGGTEVTILHERISSDASQSYTMGWTGALEKMSVLLAE
ncbi:Uncharacterized conserved protein YndB, AHSA1/START domain [Bryocella elongata]|uniref:Uncharacterized conserved protein YndB, AHSA1/START domain n=1 Tax=Bryocella elongata TaxID=863522 RepID=A0A1H5W0V8_9BACT|nr:SRPBCC domain-containing protein [Bryocella elongata]SEF93159.1 Uncharacterized conserved protein YndB, AHSA1/START domain [Bryocella elongata]